MKQEPDPTISFLMWFYFSILNLPLKSFYSQFHMTQLNQMLKEWDTFSCNLFSMHIERNCCWQEELSVWIAAEVNCLVSVMEYNSYNSIWAAATNKLIKTVSWDKASISVWLPQMSRHIHLITGTGNPIPLDVLVWQWGARVGYSHKENAKAQLADSRGFFFLISNYQELS